MSVADWPVVRAWKAATAVPSYANEPSAFAVRSAPLASVICVPTFAANPLTAVTVRVSPASGSMSLASTPGGGTVSTVSSSVVTASSTATGGSLTAPTLITTVCGAEVLAPPLAVPPLSDSVQVSVVVPETSGWSVNVSVPVAGSMAGRTANRAALVLPVRVKVRTWPASSVGPALIPVAHPMTVVSPLSSTTAIGSVPLMKLGASFTAVMVIVKVCGADVSSPPPAVPPLSCSSTVIVAVPFAFGAAV